MKFWSFLIISLFVLTCEVQDPSPHPVTAKKDDSQCVTAQKTLERLNCPEKEFDLDDDGGKISFGDFCKYENSIGVWLRPDCIATIKTCGDMNVMCSVGHKSN